VTACSFLPLDPSHGGDIKRSITARIYPALTTPATWKRKFEEAETVANAEAKIGIIRRIVQWLPAKWHIGHVMLPYLQAGAHVMDSLSHRGLLLSCAGDWAVCSFRMTIASHKQRPDAKPGGTPRRV
jgi:hypothetical protein